MLDPAFGYLIVTGIALLFASAAFHKLRARAQFTEVFVAYRVLPSALARRIAWLIPGVELGLAFGLLWPPTRPAAVMAAVVLLLGYAAGLGANLLRGRRDLDCGCGTARERRSIAPWMMWRNLLLAAALSAAVPPWSPRALSSTDAVTIVAGLIVAAVLYGAIDRLLGDVAPRTRMLRSSS